MQSNIEDEFIELEKSLKSGEFQASWLEILKDSSLRTPVLLSLAAMYFQQGSGINCCMFYAKSIFMVSEAFSFKFTFLETSQRYQRYLLEDSDHIRAAHI